MDYATIKLKLNEYSMKTLEATFDIIVDPCQVQKLEGTVSNPKLIYNVGEPTATGAGLIYTQTPDCGYEVTSTVGNLPFYANFNES